MPITEDLREVVTKDEIDTNREVDEKFNERKRQEIDTQLGKTEDAEQLFGLGAQKMNLIAQALKTKLIKALEAMAPKKEASAEEIRQALERMENFEEAVGNTIAEFRIDMSQIDLTQVEEKETSEEQIFDGKKPEQLY